MVESHHEGSRTPCNCYWWFEWVGECGSGKVTSQSVEAGQAINKGTFVSIQLNWKN